jgi:hypothetical protein
LPKINRLVPVEVRQRVFTVQYALSPYIKQTHFVFKCLTILCYNKLLFVIYLALDSYRKLRVRNIYHASNTYYEYFGQFLRYRKVGVASSFFLMSPLHQSLKHSRQMTPNDGSCVDTHTHTLRNRDLNLTLTQGWQPCFKCEAMVI